MSWRRRGAPGMLRSCDRCGATRSRSRKSRAAVTMCDDCHAPLCEKHMIWDNDAFRCKLCIGRTGEAGERVTHEAPS